MSCYWCSIVKGELVLKEAEDAKWLSKDNLDSVSWLPADLELLDLIKEVRELRNQGLGYKKIAAELKLNINTVVAYCRRNGLEKGTGEPRNTCRNCGKEVCQIKGRKKKLFCSDKCRNNWWNNHMDRVDRKAIYRYRCLNCNKEFETYGNANRKYCSHECYVIHRFKGGQPE